MKILVVVLDNLGDVVLASSILAPLRRAYPSSTFGVFVKDYARPLFDVDGLRVHSADPFWDRSPGRPKGRALPFLRTVAEIRAERYDVAYVLNADWRRALACRIAGIPVRIGHEQRKSRAFLTDARPSPDLGAHVSAAHASLLPSSSTAGLKLSAEIGLRVTQTAAAAEWRARLGWENSPIVVFHPFTGDVLKNWPLAHWTELGRLLVRARPDLRFAILHTNGEQSRLAGSFSSAGGLPTSAFQFFAGDLARVKGLFSIASLAVAGDSGPGHVAAALGCPLLSLFGPSDPHRYKALGPLVRVLGENPLSDLRPDDVLVAALAALETEESRARAAQSTEGA